MKNIYRLKKWESILLGLIIICMYLFLSDIKRWIYRGDYVYHTYFKGQKKVKIGATVIDPVYPWYVKKKSSSSIYMTSIPPRNVPFCGIVVASSSNYKWDFPVKNDPTYQCADTVRSLLGKEYDVVDCKKTEDPTLNIEYWRMDGFGLILDVTGMPETCRDQFSGLLESIAGSNKNLE
jgi:hypothetical protein